MEASTLDAALVRAVAWLGAFFTALLVYRRHAEPSATRFELALLSGALFAHLGWAILYLPRVLEFPEWILQPGAASVLFLPLGVLLVAPWRESLAALPLALAVARLGCLPYTCCYEHPANALPELAGLVLLHVLATRRLEHAPTLVLCGFGLLRIFTLPLRAPEEPVPALDPAWVACCWIVAGMLLSRRIGSVRDSSEWNFERVQPLFRSLALMLFVWLSFPVLGRMMSADLALVSAAGLALTAVLATRPPSLSVAARSIRYATVGVALGAGAALLFTWMPLFSIPTSRSLPASPAVATAVVVLIPLLEELLYRRRLLDDLRALWGPGSAILLSSGLFALAHVDPEAILIAFLGGLVCAALVLRTGRLSLSIGLHVGWNAGVLWS